MVLRAAEAWDLVARSEAAGLPLVVGYTFQFTRLAERARQALQGGEIGELLLVSGLFASMVQSLLRRTAGRLRPHLQVPPHRAEAGHLLEPR